MPIEITLIRVQLSNVCMFQSLLVQIRSEIMSDPNARLDQNPDREYDLHGAQDAFNRTVKKYGWDT